MFDYQNEIMTTDDVCEELAISKNTAYFLFHSGKLSGWKIGRTWRTTRSAMADYIRNEIEKAKK